MRPAQKHAPPRRRGPGDVAGLLRQQTVPATVAVCNNSCRDTAVYLTSKAGERGSGLVHPGQYGENSNQERRQAEITRKSTKLSQFKAAQSASAPQGQRAVRRYCGQRSTDQLQNHGAPKPEAMPSAIRLDNRRLRAVNKLGPVHRLVSD